MMTLLAPMLSSRRRERSPILVTDDAAALAKRIEANTGDRPTALHAWIKAERERLQASKPEATSAPEKTQEVAKEREETKPKDHADPERRQCDFIAARVERNDVEVAQTLKALEDRQKQKVIEGPIR